jgi:hypothetical protein
LVISPVHLIMLALAQWLYIVKHLMNVPENFQHSRNIQQTFRE